MAPYSYPKSQAARDHLARRYHVVEVAWRDNALGLRTPRMHGGTWLDRGHCQVRRWSHTGSRVQGVLGGTHEPQAAHARLRLHRTDRRSAQRHPGIRARRPRRFGGTERRAPHRCRSRGRGPGGHANHHDREADGRAAAARIKDTTGLAPGGHPKNQHVPNASLSAPRPQTPGSGGAWSRSSRPMWSRSSRRCCPTARS